MGVAQAAENAERAPPEAVRRVRIAEGGPLRDGRLNGIAASPDGSKLWVTITGRVAHDGSLTGAVLELAAFSN